MSIYFLPSSPFLVSKDSNACFAISFCVLAIRKFSAGGAGGVGMGVWWRGGKGKESLQLRLWNLNGCIQKVNVEC